MSRAKRKPDSKEHVNASDEPSREELNKNIKQSSKGSLKIKIEPENSKGNKLEVEKGRHD